MEFSYLLCICLNISESSLKKQLFEVFDIHMDKYLLPFKLSFFQLLINEHPVQKKKKKIKKSINSECNEIVVEFYFKKKSYRLFQCL